MQSDELVQRLEEVQGAGAALLFKAAAFDDHDSLQVDELARQLLGRFYEADDGEAFRLLVDVGTPLLLQAARALVDEMSLAVDPSLLVARHMADLFTDLRMRRHAEERFLVAAERSMRAMCRAQLDGAETGRRTRPPGDSGASVAPLVRVPRLVATGHVAADAEVTHVVSLGLSFLAVVQASFHALTETDRKLLLASEVRDLSYNRIAEELSIPVSQIGPLLRDARERFARRVALAYQRPVSGRGGQP